MAPRMGNACLKEAGVVADVQTVINMEHSHLLTEDCWENGPITDLDYDEDQLKKSKTVLHDEEKINFSHTCINMMYWY